MHLARQKLIYFVIFIIALYLFFQLARIFYRSLFFTKHDRINLVVYGPSTVVFSLGIHDNENYLINFPADTKVEVPGGYRWYRVGSLGKLVALEKKTDIFRKTFSLATASFVDYYFYPSKDDLYYDVPPAKKAELFPPLSAFVFLKSNANLFDRLYLIIAFSQRRKEQFRLVAWSPESGNFFKKTQGLLYQHTFRREKKNIQLIYNKSYYLAEKISIILEGNGIRVSDLTQEASNLADCRLIEGSRSPSFTTVAIADFFGCDYTSGKTGIYDIIFQLGVLEKDWEMGPN